MTDDNAAKALEDIKSVQCAGDALTVLDEHEKTIRTALTKSAKVDGLLEIVEAIRDTATGDSVTISAIKEAAAAALQRFNGEG